MVILRRHLGLCAWLAISALAIQLVASFSHFHKEDLLPAAAERTVAAGLVQASPGGAQSPAQPGDHDDHDAVCAICASMALAGTVLLPEPPALSFVFAHHAAQLPEEAAVAVSVEKRVYFQARGPPA